MDWKLISSFASICILQICRYETDDHLVPQGKKCLIGGDCIRNVSCLGVGGPQNTRASSITLQTLEQVILEISMCLEGEITYLFLRYMFTLDSVIIFSK